MKLVKLEQSEKFSNSDTCSGLEYPLNDKDIDFFGCNYKWKIS